MGGARTEKISLNLHTPAHRDLDNSVFVSLSRELFCFDYVLYTLSYVGSRDLVCQWQTVHNQNKQRFLNETLKTRCAWYDYNLIKYYILQ